MGPKPAPRSMSVPRSDERSVSRTTRPVSIRLSYHPPSQRLLELTNALKPYSTKIRTLQEIEVFFVLKPGKYYHLMNLHFTSTHEFRRGLTHVITPGNYYVLNGFLEKVEEMQDRRKRI